MELYLINTGTKSNSFYRAKQFYTELMPDKVYAADDDVSLAVACRITGKDIEPDRRVKEFKPINLNINFNDDVNMLACSKSADNPFIRGEICLAYMSDLVDDALEFISDYHHKRIFLVCTENVIKCIYKCVREGRGWSNVKDLPSLEPLECLRFSYADVLGVCEPTSIVFMSPYEDKGFIESAKRNMTNLRGINRYSAIRDFVSSYCSGDFKSLLLKHYYYDYVYNNNAMNSIYDDINEVFDELKIRELATDVEKCLLS